MPNTYKLIQAVTLASAQTAIDFTSIPDTYTDLVIKLSARTTRSEQNDYLKITFNSSTSGYADKNLATQGTGNVFSETNNGSTGYAFSYGLHGNTGTANAFGNIEIYIPNYRSSNSKGFSSDGYIGNVATTGQLAITACVWNNSAAITSISLRSHDPALSLMQYSSAELYGIVKS
jgi:hypothetical protein